MSAAGGAGPPAVEEDGRESPADHAGRERVRKNPSRDPARPKPRAPGSGAGGTCLYATSPVPAGEYVFVPAQFLCFCVLFRPVFGDEGKVVLPGM